jgi:hypothetical protein
MAIQLSAEQKYILKIFGDKTKYIIPPYQRAYSWSKNECEELFDDLVGAFENSNKDGYFLGNIILSTSKRDEFEVIDGQQRLTTMTLLLKVLFEFDKENVRLKNTIWLTDDRTGEIQAQRVQTNVFIDNDFKAFKDVLSLDYRYERPKNTQDNFSKNIFCLYEKVLEFEKNNDIKNFIDFILYDVSMLPIYTEGNSTSEAREKALKIFETTNNRGMPLDDSDIFKSNLYYMANRNNESSEFIELWKAFDEKCNDLDNSKDNKLKLRIFRIYSYMIRGQEGIKGSEIGLRDFFNKMEYSPFKNKNYKEILEKLDIILEAINLFEKNRKMSNKELAKWFQLLELYSNFYPKDTMIVYLVKNDLNTGEQTEKFAKNLVRECYSKGSTTTIKFDMYDLMVKIMFSEKIKPRVSDGLDFEYLGMLYKGFGLLGAYLNKDQQAIYPYEMLRMRDIVNFYSKDYSSFDFIGNTIPSNLTKKEIKNLDDLEDIDILDLRDIVANKRKWNEAMHERRILELKNRYKSFFEEY